LKISNIIVKNIANNAINTPMSTVVPQPTETLPYSELRGFNKVPKGVTIQVDCCEEVFVVIIFFFKFKIKQKILLSVKNKNSYYLKYGWNSVIFYNFCLVFINKYYGLFNLRGIWS